MISLNDIDIREFNLQSDSIVELTKLLHKSYKKLADVGLHFWATTQSEEQTLERIQGGKCLIAVEGGVIIGTICFYASTIREDSKVYSQKNTGRFGQFAVDPVYQKLGLGRLLLEHVEKLALKNGKSYLALDTSEKALHLITYYKLMGYLPIEYIQWDRVNYQSIVMQKRIGKKY